MFHWLHRTEPVVIPTIETTGNDGRVSLNLLLVNRSNIRIWAEEATVSLVDLDAILQASSATSQGTHWEDSVRHGLLSCGTLVKPIGRESSELYTLYYPSVLVSIMAI